MNRTCKNDKYNMNDYKCIECNKIFGSIMSLTGHKRMHGSSNGTITLTMCSCIFTKKVMPVQYLQKYQKTLKQCKQCGETFKPWGKDAIYCGHSCSASTVNSLRGPRTEATKLKIAKSIEKHNALNPRKKKIEIVGKFSKIYICNCKHCASKFISRIKKQYCELHRLLYSSSSKSGYKFTFNVYHYPDLFDIDLLDRTGWFSPGGRAGKWNINGLSRDHKVSVTEAIKNGYDPFYITHPLNCELMLHSDNNKKKTKSSISYGELIEIVNLYENNMLRRLASNQHIAASQPFTSP